MARVESIGQALRIWVEVSDALAMISEANRHLNQYAADVIGIYEKMPAFDFVHFCFYAYDTSSLFEHMLGVNPRDYQTFSLEAPDAFFFTLYGGVAALYPHVKRIQSEEIPVT